MKKIIGILGVAVIAGTIFFNVNSVSESTQDLNLASLTSLNTANAEDAKCIIVEVIKMGFLGQNGKKCYRDVDNGDDILEGYVRVCYGSPNSNCQPQRCDVQSEYAKCYEID